MRDDLAELREWDAYAGTAVGPWLRVIALNIGGVNFYRKHEGQLTLTYVAPWAPAEQLHCAMGYGSWPSWISATSMASDALWAASVARTSAGQRSPVA